MRPAVALTLMMCALLGTSDARAQRPPSHSHAIYMTAVEFKTLTRFVCTFDGRRRSSSFFSRTSARPRITMWRYPYFSSKLMPSTAVMSPNCFTSSTSSTCPPAMASGS